jgi:hypothetical protein
MKVLWLNDSLVLRAESIDEKKALAIIGRSLEPNFDKDADCNEEGHPPQSKYL